MTTRDDSTIKLYSELEKEALYALRSLSRDLVHECYGKVKMARQLLAIDADQASVLNDMLVRYGLNDPKFVLENYGGALE